MWLSNGYPNGVRDLWSSSDGVSWTRVLEHTPYDVYSKLVVFHEKLWAISSSVWSTSNGVDWVRVAPTTPFCCAGSVVVHDDKLWQLGVGPFVWWSSDGVQWHAATRAAPFGNRNAAVAVFEGKLWVLGGGMGVRNKGYPNAQKTGYPDLDMKNDVWCSKDGTNWRRVLDHAPWKGRMWSTAQFYGDRLWLMAGYDNDVHANLSDVWFTTDGVQWEEFRSQPQWSARHQPTSYVFDDSLWMVAGNSWPFNNDVWRLKMSLDSRSFKWSRIVPHVSSLRRPPASHDAAFTGDLLPGPMRSEHFTFFDTTEVSLKSKGFNGGVFDGRYLYFVPMYDGVAFSGVVTRYDTTAPFNSKRSWTVFDTTTVQSESKGYVGAVFDGRYIYFAPFFNGASSGEVMRYDTSGTFTSASSWVFYDTAAINEGSKGFRGAVFDGRYVYFVPFQRGIFDKGELHGQVTRYDTTLPFGEAASWAFYDTAAVNAHSKGFIGAVFDGRYVYLVPNSDEQPHGQVTRYDTAAPFTSPSSWSFFDTTRLDKHSNGFEGGVFDGRYVYFVPFYNDEGVSGQVARYDSTGPFASPSSWRVYDTTAVDPGSRGFSGAVFDGRYIYYVPHGDGTPHGQVTRFDTNGSFTSADAWSVFDMTTMNGSAMGFKGGVFDGRHIYLVPDYNGAAHGLVARIEGFAGGVDRVTRLALIALAQDHASNGEAAPAPEDDVEAASAPGSLVTKTAFEKTNTALSNVKGLATRVVAGNTYTFEFTGFVTASPVGGYKFAMACTCNATSVIYDIVAIDNRANKIRISSRHTLFGGNDGNAVATNVSARITGTVTVASDGALAPQFAQEVAHGTSIINAGSKFEVHAVTR